MQLKSSRDAEFSGWRRFAFGRISPILISALLLFFASGCPSNPAVVTAPKEPQPFEGAKIKLVCSDAAVGKAFASRAQGWASRKGASVEAVVVGDGDVVILPSALVGAMAESGDALPVPDELKTLDHTGQWIRIMPNYRDRLAGWAGSARSIPLAGDGQVLVLNADRLNSEPLRAKYSAKFGRSMPAIPGTWDDVAEIAEACQDLGLKAFPARSDDETRTLSDFFRVAACTDRPALAESDVAKRDGPVNVSMALLSFTHVADTGEPRLNTPSFAAAAKWLARMEPSRTTEDAVASVTSGRAAMAVLTLAELGRLPRDAKGMVPANLRIAPLPGSRTAFDAKGNAVDFSTRPGGNYVPYFSGGWFGVVRKSSTQVAASFDLLADLASPSRSLELLSDPLLGFGPFRSEHLQQPRENIWQRYGFDAERQRLLAEALRKNAGEAIVNPTFALRGPDASELTLALAKALKDGRPLNGVWPSPDTTQRSWRRHAVGLP